MKMDEAAATATSSSEVFKVNWQQLFPGFLIGYRRQTKE